jgi:hypothetical protein
MTVGGFPQVPAGERCAAGMVAIVPDPSAEGLVDVFVVDVVLVVAEDAVVEGDDEHAARPKAAAAASAGRRAKATRERRSEGARSESEKRRRCMGREGSRCPEGGLIR